MNMNYKEWQKLTPRERAKWASHVELTPAAKVELEERVKIVGPIKKKGRKKKLRLIVIGHPKFIAKNLPTGAREFYDLTIESTFKKPKGSTTKGDATDAMVIRARRKMDEGMTAAEAAADTAAFMQSRADMSKLYPDRREGEFRGKWYPADKPGLPPRSASTFLVKGTTCAALAFMRATGIFHTFCSRSISDQRASATSARL
jgi:hypothetical protein